VHVTTESESKNGRSRIGEFREAGEDVLRELERVGEFTSLNVIQLDIKTYKESEKKKGGEVEGHVPSDKDQNMNHPQLKVDRTASHPPLLPDCRASHPAQRGAARAHHVESMPYFRLLHGVSTKSESDIERGDRSGAWTSTRKDFAAGRPFENIRSNRE
jgi:hypothetical protein